MTTLNTRETRIAEVIAPKPSGAIDQHEREARRQAIRGAAMEILATGGYPALTFRALAGALGGSMTLVTHYYPTQDELLLDLRQEERKSIASELAVLPRTGEARRDLQVLLDWLVPSTPPAMTRARVRVLLAIHGDSDGSQRDDHLGAVERLARTAIRERLGSAIQSGMLDLAIDLVRVATNGIVLSSVEHPDHWASEQQQTTLKLLLRSLPWKAPDAPSA